jgi:small-conductance mechanosensitive channel
MKVVIDLNSLSPFFNSNFFVGLATILTGVAAFVVYKLQKRDEKVNASRIILSEIRSAEDKLKLVKKKIKGSAYEDFPVVLPINSWVNFSHLFAKDFDSDELDRINNFFSNCQSIDEMASKDNNFFWITAEERARVVQQQLPQIVAAAYDANTNKVDKEKLEILKQTILDTVSNEPYAYVPKKTVSAITTLIDNTQMLTNTPIGEKFKKLAK